jgi:DNA-binding transcriptional MerR regulator
MESVYRVHQFAELAGVTIKALRHYDRLGLLKPARSDAGYRLYRLADTWQRVTDFIERAALTSRH